MQIFVTENTFAYNIWKLSVADTLQTAGNVPVTMDFLVFGVAFYRQ